MKTLSFSLAALALSAASAWAAPHPGPAGTADRALARYEHDRAECLSGKTSEDRKTCLREAGAALEQARHGGLDVAHEDYQANEAQRCDPLPADDKAACLALVRGRGTVSGSVADGAIVREYRQIVPATGASQPAS